MNAPGILPNAALYRLQEILFPAPGRPADLYLVTDRPARAAGGELACPAGAALDFGTYFNAFYLGFWAAHGAVDDLVLRLSLRGRARIRVERRQEGTPPRVLAEQVLDGDGAPFVLPIPEPGEEGHLAVLLDCLTACRLDALSFATGQPPAPVRLSVGICTHAREAKLRDTLDALARIRAGLPDMVALFLVNQGPAFRDPATAAAAARAGATVIEQPNLGGAGGFARGLWGAATVLRGRPITC